MKKQSDIRSFFEDVDQRAFWGVVILAGVCLLLGIGYLVEQLID